MKVEISMPSAATVGNQAIRPSFVLLRVERQKENDRE